MNYEILKDEDIDTLQEMKFGKWYYTVGEKFKECMDRLVKTGFVVTGENPIGDWPAYKRFRSIRGYTRTNAIKNNMEYSEARQCPECGCPWYGNRNLLREGSRTCCDCHEDWWVDIEYKYQAKRRELPE